MNADACMAQDPYHRIARMVTWLRLDRASVGTRQAIHWTRDTGNRRTSSGTAVFLLFEAAEARRARQKARE
jgi:hypothetical protein